jgi:hypothetical protein
MNLKLIVAILVIAAVPMSAQAQKPSAANVTKADAQKVVKMISGDKAKTQTYCDIAKLGEEIEQANEKKDTKKADELSQKMDELDKTGSRICRVDGRVSGDRPGVPRRSGDRFDVRGARQVVCEVASRFRC